MKEIDTETSVVWPSWCYSDNLRRNLLKECCQVDKELYAGANKALGCHRLSEITARAEIDQKKTKIAEKKMLSERSLLLSGYSINNTIESVKPNCEKSNTPLTAVSSAAQGTGLTITPTAAAAAYLYLEKVKHERMSPRVATAHLDSLKDAIMESSAAAAVAAAMVNNNNSNNDNANSINNNNNDNDVISNSKSNIVSGGPSSSTASNCSNNSNISNLLNSQVQSSTANHTVNNTSDDLPCHSLKKSTNHTQQEQQQQQQHQIHKHQHQQVNQHLQSSSQQQQQQQQSLHMSSNNVKKERLSPGTNGDHQTSLSRSRSTTPSSFRGTSPQQSIHSSPSDTIVPMHNLSTNLLNSIHQASAVSSNRHPNLSVSSSGINTANTVLPADFSTRNYSDFMRSLAAKYNNTNTNENLKRNSVFEMTTNSCSTAQKKTSISAQKTPSFASIATTPINKEVSITSSCGLPPPPTLTSVSISPGESSLKLTQQNKFAAAVANAAAVCSSNMSPYMTSFLSSLPFSPVSLIDMSSTQALITLARAAKENEIHYILNASTPHQKRTSACISSSSSPTINMALQQAAQYISPALLYSTQVQKQLQQQQQVSRQSSPRLANFSDSTSSCNSAKNSLNHTDKMNVSPLDLSSQPPAAKRFKAESTSSHSSADGQINSTITRRGSSSTATSSPSPPPFKEKSPSASTSADDVAFVPIVGDVFGSSTKIEAATSAPSTSIKITNSTSTATSLTAVAPAVAVRQCQAQSEELNSWTVDDVCAFVRSIDICAEYETNFRDQCIDGSGLPLLTEDHLVNSLGMKLGPALKLRSVLAKKLGGPCPCVACIAQIQQVLALQSSNMTATSTPIVATTSNESKICDPNRNASITDINSNICNRHIHKKSLTIGSDINYSSNNNDNNNSVNQNESTTNSANAISINTTTELHLSTDSNIVRSGSNCITNIGNFSSPSPQQKRNQEQTSTQNICNKNSSSSSGNITSNNGNATTNRHDNADSSS